MGAKGKGSASDWSCSCDPLLPPPHASQAGSRGPLSCGGWRHKLQGRGQVPRLCLSSATNPELLFPSTALEDSFSQLEGMRAGTHGSKEVPLALSSATRACRRLSEDGAVLECGLGFVTDQKDPEGLFRAPDPRGSLLGTSAWDLGQAWR